MDAYTVTHDGRETAYWIDEDRVEDDPVVLYVHGSGCRHDVWRLQTGREGSTAVTMDLSGHGDSADVDTPAGPETMDAYVADVETVARETDADVIVGHSLGGAVVQTLVLDGEYDPKGAVLADTGAKLGVGDDLGDLLGDDIDLVLDFLNSADILFHGDHEEAPANREMMREEGLAMLRRDLLTCNDFDVRDRLGEIDQPTLCIVGDHDNLTPVSFTEYLAEHIPNATYAAVPGCSHMSMLQNAPAFNADLDEFLAGL
ncbi:MAG: alpha/beta fold hydrolase [Haloarculaceae archaeon]